MNIYILGKQGNLSQDEWKLRYSTASLAFIDGHHAVNFNDEPSLNFEDQTLELVKEITYLVEADAIWLLADFNQCENARLMLAIAIRLNLPVHPCNNCIVPPRICFDLKF